MKELRRQFDGLALVHLLLLLAVTELSINRLAVPALRPGIDEAPPTWHVVLDHIGLFLFYFTSTLAIAVMVASLVRLASRRDLYFKFARVALLAAGTGFAMFAAVNLVMRPGANLSFALQTSFAVFIVLVLIAQLRSAGDLGAKIGMACLAAPLLIHYYAPLSFRFFAGEEAAWGSLPEQIQRIGQWSLVVAALVSPYCFAPRPIGRSLMRIAPVGIAVFVAVLGALVLRRHYEVGMLIAARGLGVDLGVGAPSEHIALYLVAFGTIAWTMTSCFIADTVSRRDIGVGIALVVVGGYGFAWPLQYLLGAIGLLSIGEAASSVRDEERGLQRQRFRPPPIDDQVWHGYVNEVVEALKRESSGETTFLTARDGELSNTHIICELRGIPVRVRMLREAGALSTVRVSVGRDGGDATPDLTLYARPERLLGTMPHPEPPRLEVAVHTTGDEPFDARFRVRDGGGHCDRLFDAELRARASALIDGWLAYWKGEGLRYELHPGCGAPLDNPIPISELAFRGSSASVGVDRFVRVISLLVELAARAGVDEVGGVAADSV